MEFKHEHLPKLFEGIRKGTSMMGTKYVVSGLNGDVAEINYLGNNEWRIFIYNFPMQKKFFTYNFPIDSAGQFMEDMKRIGLNLKLL